MTKLLAILPLLLALTAFAQTSIPIPLPFPVTQVQTGRTVVLQANRPIEQCVLVTRGTNGTFGRQIDVTAMSLRVLDDSGEFLTELTKRIPQPLSVEQEELSSAASILGKTWKPASSEDELAVIVFALVRKLGENLVPAHALNQWATQVSTGLQSRVTSPEGRMP